MISLVRQLEQDASYLAMSHSLLPPTFTLPYPSIMIRYLREPIQQNMGYRICIYTQPTLASAEKPDCQFASSKMMGRSNALTVLSEL